MRNALLDGLLRRHRGAGSSLLSRHFVFGPFCGRNRAEDRLVPFGRSAFGRGERSGVPGRFAPRPATFDQLGVPIRSAHEQVHGDVVRFVGYTLLHLVIEADARFQKTRLVEQPVVEALAVPEPVSLPVEGYARNDDQFHVAGTGRFARDRFLHPEAGFPQVVPGR